MHGMNNPLPSLSTPPFSPERVSLPSTVTAEICGTHAYLHYLHLSHRKSGAVVACSPWNKVNISSSISDLRASENAHFYKINVLSKNECSSKTFCCNLSRLL